MNRLSALGALLVLAAAPHAGSAQETLVIPPEVMEAIQSDVATIHMDLMQANIRLQAGQSGTFWAIYDEYLAEVKSLAAQRTELMKDFALAFDTMTNESAMEMGRRGLAIDAQRNEGVGKYFERIGREVGGMVAGQYLQIEARIQTIKDFRLELEVPIIGG